MKISSAALAANLQNPRPPYLLLNNEPVLLTEDRDSVRKALACDERKLFVLDQDFDMEDAKLEASAGNLFGGSTLLEFILVDALNADTAKQLTAIAKLAQAKQRPVIIASPNIVRKAAWVNQLEDFFTVVTQVFVKRHNMCGWVKARGRSFGLDIDDEAAQYIADMTEGNLSSAAQEISKLKLLHVGSEQVSRQLVQELLVDQSRDDLFSLRESLAAGSSVRSLRAIRNLKAAKVPPTLLVWALAEETRSLLRLIDRHSKPRGVYGKHLTDLANIAKRVPRTEVKYLLAVIARADWVAKGMIVADPWQDFERIAIAFTQLVSNNRYKFLLLQNEFKPQVKAN